MLETPQANLVAGRQWFLSTYTSRFKRSQDSEAGRAQVAQYLEGRRWEQRDEEPSGRIRRGWCLGRAAFRQELLAAVAEKRGPHPLGEEGPESQIERAERLVPEGLAANGWTEADLGQRPKTDRLKVALAQELRRESVVSLSWMAQRLHRGSVSTLKNALHYANSLV